MPSTTADLDSLLSTVAADHRAPAVLGACSRGRELLWAGAEGYLGCGPGAARATLGSVSRWYSITKPLTALVLLRAGIDLDRPLVGLVPGLDFADPVARERACLRDCLLHRTGLAEGNWTWDGVTADPAELVKRIVHLPGRRHGQGFAYQNITFNLAERAMAAHGLDWHTAVNNLLGELGAVTTTDSEGFRTTPGRLEPCGPSDLAPAASTPEPEVRHIPAAAAVCGTVTGLAAVGRAMAGAGFPLPTSAWQQAIAPVQALGPSSMSERDHAHATLAGRIEHYRGEPCLVWAGGFRGWVSHVVALPGLGLSACALANRSASHAAEATAFALLDHTAGWQPADWSARYLSHKQSLRERSAARLAARASAVAGPWPTPGNSVGSFHHPAYGTLQVVAGDSGLHPDFRHVTVPLHARSDGTIQADGDCAGETIAWDLRWDPATPAWWFNPDAGDLPLPFCRCD